MDLDPQKAKYVNTKRAAAALGLAMITLVKWRAKGTGPTYVRFGGRILYPTVALLEFIETQTIRS